MKKRFIFENHALISTSTVALVAISTLVCGYEEAWKAIGATLLGSLSFSYFCQQQKLSETLLFKQLFTEFNCRYDKLNDILSDIRSIDKDFEPDPKQIKKLIDYFNLCAEEFLFREEGYIPDHVWGAWCRGILINLKHPVIQLIWEKELASNSYYGMTLEKIEIGSKI